MVPKQTTVKDQLLPVTFHGSSSKLPGLKERCRKKKWPPLSVTRARLIPFLKPAKRGSQHRANGTEREQIREHKDINEPTPLTTSNWPCCTSDGCIVLSWKSYPYTTLMGSFCKVTMQAQTGLNLPRAAWRRGIVMMELVLDFCWYFQQPMQLTSALLRSES